MNLIPNPFPLGEGAGVRSFGDLIRTGSYRLHSRFPRAVNFLNGSGLVSVVDLSVGAGPLNIVLDTIPEYESGTMKIENDCALFNGLSLTLNQEQRYDSLITLPGKTDTGLLQANLDLFKNHLLATAPPESLSYLLAPIPPKNVLRIFENVLRIRLIEGAELLRQGRLSAGVEQIKGLGHGLTPQGDDFIAGLLFALHLRDRAFGEPVERKIRSIGEAARSENPFSRAMLYCAARGRAFARLKTLIESLLAFVPSDIEENTRGLLSVGATSGADLGAGLVFGLEQMP